MSSLFSSVLAHASRNQQFLLLQSSTAQTCLPVLRAIVKQASARARETTLLFSLLYPPSSFLDQSHLPSDSVQVVDRTADVPGYYDDSKSERDRILALENVLLEKIRTAPGGPLNVVIDSADTLLSDIGSLSETTKLLAEALSLIRARGASSRLILHVLAPSPLISVLTQTRFSSSLTYLIAHPPALLTHLASAYLTPPPPLSSPEKFWGVFIPIAERHYESEKLVFGPGGEGTGSSQEFVVELIVRGGADGSGRRRAVERKLEGWSVSTGAPCELDRLESLKAIWSRKPVLEAQVAPDPTKNLPFNLNLTPEQQRSRAQVPLPYAHEGKPTATSAILYDPDSADDLDDDDPDEDLDI